MQSEIGFAMADENRGLKPRSSNSEEGKSSCLLLTQRKRELDQVKGVSQR
jgi:hypothetical protein